jgi:hypothetical protein
VQPKNINLNFGRFLPLSFYSKSKEWNLCGMCKYEVVITANPPNNTNFVTLKLNVSLNEQ